MSISFTLLVMIANFLWKGGVNIIRSSMIHAPITRHDSRVTRFSRKRTCDVTGHEAVSDITAVRAKVDQARLTSIIVLTPLSTKNISDGSRWRY